MSEGFARLRPLVWKMHSLDGDVYKIRRVYWVRGAYSIVDFN